MKILGIIGGVGPESTLDYYRLIQQRYRELVPDGSYPHVIINSVDAGRMVGPMFAGRYDEVIDYLSAEIARLAKAGPDFALIAANTPHIFYPQLAARSPMPLLSIVEATRDAARVAGHKRVGLFGTRVTMEADFYQQVFAGSGIGLVAPAPEERTYIHDIYINQLLKNQFLPETGERLLAIAADMKRRDQIDGLILAGTELPLLLRDAVPPVPYLDTTVIHVEAAVTRMLS
jgi:aspartate racemase